KLSRKNLKEALSWESGAGYALLGAIGTGIFFLFVGITVQLVGWLVNAVLIRVGIAATTFAIILYRKKKVSSLFKNVPMKWILPAAILDVIGFSLYNIAVTGGEVSVVTMITSAQTLVVILLSWAILKEKITKIQFLGIASIFIGLLFLNFI
ncbi:MAG: EamA family transporter, partial [Candidatus Roizmanbacteria bacterium]